MTRDLFKEAFCGDILGDLGAGPIPSEIVHLLTEVHAPPRLIAHLRLVGATARKLLNWFESEYSVPGVRDKVLFGAYTHDIGKVVHPEELSGPGHAHEGAGEKLLISRGFDSSMARYAGTHSSWNREDITIEDLLVSLADKTWKGSRVEELESRFILLIEASTREPAWTIFDTVLSRLCEGADLRIQAQSFFPV